MATVFCFKEKLPREQITKIWKEFVMDRPVVITDKAARFDSFKNGEVLAGKKKGRLPAMGWNSWNAFGSGNTEELTKAMADKIVELGLDKLGYKYVVLDDGCYKPERAYGLLSNEEVKFPSGFKALADYIHGKGLKFGMYNDIGTNLCAGAAVGTCGHETVDAKTYFDWDVDFIKVDNCYYLWDNATFSNAENAKYTYAPNIKGAVVSGEGLEVEFAAADMELTGKGGMRKNAEEITGENFEYITNIGTFDGTGPDHSPVGAMSSEAVLNVYVPVSGEYELSVEYATGKEPGIGSWLQVATSYNEKANVFYDDFLEETADTMSFKVSQPIKVKLNEGENIIRLMNHRRQENTLASYAALHEGFMKADPERDIVISICEWGKTQPQNWGYKVGDSWRILNDITFQVGSDGDPGKGAWASDYTTSVCAQYNKAVIMDEFAGLYKGWNDPDMLMIGMNGLDMTMCRTHMTMWCLMNSPLMLGLDLRKVTKGDEIYEIISNEDVIALNQDALGIQAKRVYTTFEERDCWNDNCEDVCRPDKCYIRDNDRVDVLAKPLKNGNFAISFINLSDTERVKPVTVDKYRILSYLGDKVINREEIRKANAVEVYNVWTKKRTHLRGEEFSVSNIPPHDNVTLIVTPIEE